MKDRLGIERSCPNCKRPLTPSNAYGWPYFQHKSCYRKQIVEDHWRNRLAVQS